MGNQNNSKLVLADRRNHRNSIVVHTDDTINGVENSQAVSSQGYHHDRNNDLRSSIGNNSVVLHADP